MIGADLSHGTAVMGRELDALVAEKVLRLDAHRRSDGKPHYLLPFYSSDIGAAFEVLAHLQSVRCITPFVIRIYGNAVMAAVELRDGEHVELVDVGSGRTAAEAICRAALKIVERPYEQSKTTQTAETEVV